MAIDGSVKAAALGGYDAEHHTAIALPQNTCRNTEVEAGDQRRGGTSMMCFQGCETAQCCIGGIERIPMLTEKQLVGLENKSAARQPHRAMSWSSHAESSRTLPSIPHDWQQWGMSRELTTYSENG